MLQSMQITLAFIQRPTIVAAPPQNMQTRLSITKKFSHEDAKTRRIYKHFNQMPLFLFSRFITRFV